MYCKLLIASSYAAVLTGRNTGLARPSVRPSRTVSSLENTKPQKKNKIRIDSMAGVTGVPIFSSKGHKSELELRSSRRTAA